MSNEDRTDQHGGWEPTPQGGEYDAEATAFVHLPPEDLDGAPLAAPGHGYVPPMILPLTPAAGLDPAATGNWVVRAPEGTQPEQPAPDAVHWPDPNQQGTGYGYPDPAQYANPYREDPAATGHWNFTDAGNSADASGHTGQWTVPVADGDLPEESGEFPVTAAADWYADRSRPATLPGGAPAPWATQEPEPEPVPDAEPADAETGTADGPEAEAPPAADGVPGTPETPAHEAAPDARQSAPEPDGREHGAPGHETPESPGHEAPEQDGPAPVDTAETPDEAPADDEAAEDAPPALDLPSEHPAASYVLHVNGTDRPVTDAWIGESLLYVLRERLGLAGAKDGCSQGECGACNVQVDGRLVASCLVPAATAAGSEVRTVEGLAVDGEPSDVQRALAGCGAVQCGFCIPGMAMTVHDLLEGNHAPSELETRQALCGNLCRCSGYRGVLDAVNEVIAGREAAAEAAAAPAPESAEPDEARIPHQAPPGAGSVQAHLQDGGTA
ncbi:2Fe-2S iron-sulfur cluster-binding protein [Streptomyces sp. ITFR-16]|uniref:2Fe-2S iron-sulfur cluster-binding protein n=1 Tax=Streptomyces sp. ITFR-16 TaxID=3075198 RepID=UPI00288BC5C2|nr:2Fe-2S iron-sulfur cluster-binding protein [Streptomyces sp. ITFR-16]WNI24516.1 2Fe-2S iron-sulfur cluster-binding protein [Streptomyces sp. ITFR-16]